VVRTVETTDADIGKGDRMEKKKIDSRPKPYIKLDELAAELWWERLRVLYDKGAIDKERFVSATLELTRRQTGIDLEV